MSKRCFLGIIFVCLCVVPAYLGQGAPMGFGANKRAAMLRHIVFFESVFRQSNNSSTMWLLSLRGKVESELMTEDDWGRFFATIVADSKVGQLKAGLSGFVKDDEVVDVLVSALEDSETARWVYVFDFLTWEVGTELRTKYAGRIREALGAHPEFSQAIHLFAKCDLNPQQKQDVLSWENVPDETRALCGDATAEADLISRFKSSTEYFEKAKLARQLAYVGTQNCTNALIDGLRSLVAIENRYESRSIRGPILRALGIIYNEEKLFTTDAYLLEMNSDGVFDRRYGLEKYISDVNDWVSERFGHPAWDSSDIWFRRMHAVPIDLPIGH